MTISDQRLTQPDWCNAPQPGNFKNACMRAPGHDMEHACRKSYRLDEAWIWRQDGYPVSYGMAARFPDLWHPDETQVVPPETVRGDR